MIAIVMVMSLAAVGAYALFMDQESSTENVLGASTLDLTVNDQDDPISLKFAVEGIAPGYESGYQVWCLKNTGTEPGKPRVEFSTIVNSENTEATEPEIAAEEEIYASEDGELGQYLKYTIGTAPCGWSVPSRLVSMWQTGPSHPWGVPGLNNLSGYVYDAASDWPILNENETIGFFMKTSLEDDLRRWDGTKWLDVDDNIIQSDSVEFDITFYLEQVGE